MLRNSASKYIVPKSYLQYIFYHFHDLSWLQTTTEQSLFAMLNEKYYTRLYLKALLSSLKVSRCENLSFLSTEVQSKLID